MGQPSCTELGEIGCKMRLLYRKSRIIAGRLLMQCSRQLDGEVKQLQQLEVNLGFTQNTAGGLISK